MKNYFGLIIVLSLLSCGNENQQPVSPPPADTIMADKIIPTDTMRTVPPSPQSGNTDVTPTPTSKTYQNDRFRDVSVQRVADNRFRVRGKAQMFEATVSWVIEDGHNELKSGFTTADKGAPAWGNFDFTVDAKKDRQNSTLHLLLFESSAKDGSRQHQLFIPMP